MITKSMLIKKDIWDLVLLGSCFDCQNPTLWIKKVKKSWVKVKITKHIITKSVSNQIAFNTMNLEDPKKM